MIIAIVDIGILLLTISVSPISASLDLFTVVINLLSLPLIVKSLNVAIALPTTKIKLSTLLLDTLKLSSISPSKLSTNVMIASALFPLISFTVALMIPFPLTVNNEWSGSAPAITPLSITEIVLINTLLLLYLILASPVSSFPNLLSTKLTLAT